MKFQYRGGLDTPDWVLANIQLVSRLNLETFEQICKVISQDMTEAAGMEFFEDIAKICEMQGMTTNDTKSVVSAIKFIIKSACRFDTSPTVLDKELQQLGLPKKHSNVLCSAYEKEILDTDDTFAPQVLKVTHLKKIKTRVVNEIETTNLKTHCPLALVDLDYDYVVMKRKKSFSVDRKTLQIMIKEMKEIEEMMD